MMASAGELFNIDDGTTTRLSEEEIPGVGYANEVFGKVLSDGSTPVVLLPGRNCIKPYLTIPEGCYAMVQRFGADYNHPLTNKPIWSPGFHFAPPWVKVSHLVTKQLLVFNTPVKGCKTADNVTVTIDVTLSLRIMGDEDKGEDPELVRTFVYKLTPRGLAQQLKDAQEEAVRALARSVNHTAVYGLRSAETHETTEMAAMEVLSEEDRDKTNARNVTDAMRKTLNNQFNKVGVEITDVAITNVRLPKEIAIQMQEKTTYASVISEQKKKQENEMQQLSYMEEKETTLQKKREEAQAEQAQGVRVCAEKQKELNTVQAETRKMLAELREMQNAAVREIRANDELEIERIKMEAEKITRELQAKAEAEKARIIADRDAHLQNVNAQIVKLQAEYNAKGEKARADAEGQAASKLRTRREIELEMDELNVYEQLAKNKSVVISGGQNNLLADMLITQRNSQILLSVDGKGLKQ